MSKKITISILEELAEDPAETMRLKLKSRLMNAIISNIQENDMTQTEAAILVQVQRTRFNDVCNGRIDRNTIDALVVMAARLGIDSLRSVA